MLPITSSGKSLMYSRKSVGPRMEPSGIPAFTGYWFWFILSDYCDFPDF